MALVTSLASSVTVGRGCTGPFWDVECIRAGEKSRRCSTGGQQQQQQQRGQWLSGKSARVGVTRERREFGGFQSYPPVKERFQDPLCVIQGLNGASCEDNESVANNSPSTKVDLPTESASVLKRIIQEIEPLDIILISKDVSPNSTDAMKRTISGMLGLLPSDQFQVVIESSREPVGRLLVSSMMTGYTLRNGEYRLCLKRSLENTEVSTDDRCERDMVEEHMMEVVSGVGMDMAKQLVEGVNSPIMIGGDSFGVMERAEQVAPPAAFGAMSPEVAAYIQQLQAKLATTSKELEECKHTLTTLEMESMAGEDTNDLLDYLRSLDPEKVAELSQPTSPEVENIINEVVDGLLANLCTDRVPTGASFGDGINVSHNTWEEKNTSEALGSIPLEFHSTVTASRDYLARSLFWCMLLGHYMRAVEYRLELSRTLSLSGESFLGMERSRQS